MAIQRPAVPKAEKVQLGEGVVVFNFNPNNWDDNNTVPFGATRGGGSYTVEPTNHPIRFDGDRGENTKGMKRRMEWNITIETTALELDLENIAKIMPGKINEVDEASDVPNYKLYRPNVEFTEEDYIDNMAYITETKDGRLVAYVIENVLGDGTLTAAFAEQDELTSEVTFTAHFDPNKMNSVPTYVVYYEKEQSEIEE
ncbi:hypothetical protein [Evansella halocellulosilytica]|uniref:hypothetical protein n=1 Tax=Evansella halocellulosilytica TaxID=2011013 RepID=UPI000BB7ECF1|nr:hypothetical protein [Evansella halocellulosilytica]